MLVCWFGVGHAIGSDGGKEGIWNASGSYEVIVIASMELL
jgi:hypothetical protein